MEWLHNTDGGKVPGLGIALLFFTNYLRPMKPKRTRSLFKRMQHSLLGLKKNLNVLFRKLMKHERTRILLKRASVLLKKNAHSFETYTRSFQKNVPYLKRTSVLLIKRTLF